MNIEDSLSIVGPGAGKLTISGNNSSRIFGVFGRNVVSISGLTLTKGNPGQSFGGAVLNYAMLALSDDVLSNNVGASLKVDGAYGGGAALCNFGSADVTGCTFENNTVYGHDESGNDGGGAIYNAGTLTLTSSTVNENYAAFSPSSDGSTLSGGGLFNRGTAAVVNCSLYSNVITVPVNDPDGTPASESDYGGGIYSSGTLTVKASTIAYNILHNDCSEMGSGYGGGVCSEGTTLIENSTIAHNISGKTVANGIGVGGGLTVDAGTTTLVNDTVAFNEATGYGGGLDLEGGKIVLGNTIVAENIDDGESHLPLVDSDIFLDAQGTIQSIGYNLIGNDGQGQGSWLSSDLVGEPQPYGTGLIDANLVDLANNGGPTQTCAIAARSPAHDAGSAAIASEFGLTTDQRGLPRVVSGKVDIGAFEL